MTASAQWLWIDRDGHKVFSDLAPPADILDKNILKRPGERIVPRGFVEASGNLAVDTTAATPQAQASAAKTPASGLKISGVDKELAERKKKADEAETAKIKADEERVVKGKIESCARAKQAKAGLDSGRRITRYTEKGEPQVLDPASRAAELTRIQSILDSDCN